ncbi:MAG: tetratricopeptide repeat protein [Bacteroidales bacterium]|nr:tetratricopeptide repeat protein [Bacteroidales bacterium]
MNPIVSFSPVRYISPNTVVLIFLLSLFVHNFQYGQETTWLTQQKEDSPVQDSGLVDHFYRQAFQYFQSDPDTSRLLLEKGLELADQLRYHKGRINILSGFGYYGIVRGDYSYALQYLNQALDEADLYGVEIAKGSIRNGLGLVYTELTEYPQALGFYQQAYDQFLAAGDSGRAGSILANIGVIHCKQMNYRKGIGYFEKVLQIAEKTGNTYQRLQVLGVMANAYESLQEHQQAEICFKEVLRIARELNIPLEIGLSCGNLGKACFMNGRIDEAIRYTREAVDILEKLDAQHFLVSNYANLAKCYAAKGRFDIAGEWARKAEATAGKVGSFEKESWALEAFIDLHEKQHNYKDANAFLHELLVIKDSIYSSEQKDKIAELETKFNVKQKEQEIKLLTKDKEINQLEISSKRQTIRYLVAGLLLLVLFAALLFSLYRKTKQSNRELIRKNLELMKKEENMQPDDSPDILIHPESDRYLEAKRESLLGEFKQLMHHQRFYRQPGITLERVAEQLNSNRTYLSGMINSHFQTNFSTLINRYRIMEARRLLINPVYRNYTIESIAKEVGFISKSVFNEAFKRETGLTPSYFQQHAPQVELLADSFN